MSELSEVSGTRRVPLDIVGESITALQTLMPDMFRLRPYKFDKPTFTSIISQKSEEDTLADVVKQKGQLKLPMFVITKTGIERALDGANNYISKRDGIRIGMAKGRTEMITVHATSVRIPLIISMFTQDFNIANHMAEVVMMYAEEEFRAGEVEITDPLFAFSIILTFAPSVDFPEPTEFGGIKGFKIVFSVTLKSYVADLEFTPTISQVSADTFLTGLLDADNKYTIIANRLDDQITDPVTKVEYLPGTNFTVDIRSRITNPFLRD